MTNWPIMLGGFVSRSGKDSILMPLMCCFWRRPCWWPRTLWTVFLRSLLWSRNRFPLLLLSKSEGSPGSPNGKESVCNARDLGSIPGLERSPGGGNEYPLQDSDLENSMDRGAWQAVAHGVTLLVCYDPGSFPLLILSTSRFALLQYYIELYMGSIASRHSAIISFVKSLVIHWVMQEVTIL